MKYNDGAKEKRSIREKGGKASESAEPVSTSGFDWAGDEEAYFLCRAMQRPRKE